MVNSMGRIRGHYEWDDDHLAVMLATAQRARAELGYRFRPLKKGMEGTIAWLRESGQWPGRSPEARKGNGQGTKR